MKALVTQQASSELAEKLGHYESYPNSPASKGILQYDMWDVTPTDLLAKPGEETPTKLDWPALKSRIAK